MRGRATTSLYTAYGKASLLFANRLCEFLLLVYGIAHGWFGVIHRSGAYLIGGGMQSLLFDITKIGYPVLVAVSAVLMLAALAACLLPAQRAASVDSMQALKSQ
jgi:ABC-type antimicrobial peptide transport system permease subunit